MGALTPYAQILVPIAFIVIGLLAGWISEKIIFPSIKKVVMKTKWPGDEIIVNGFRGMLFLWFILAGIYGALLTLSITPLLLTYAIKTIVVIIILSFTVVATRIAVGFVHLYTNKFQGVLFATSIFANLTKLFFFLIGILIILQILGIPITPILTALGVGGLAIALALQPTLSNLFAGLHILASRGIKPGDYIKIDSGEEGYVVDISWRNTTIKTLPNNLVIVPNDKIASAIVTNYYLPEQGIKVYVPVGVSYDSDLEKVEIVTIEVAKEIMNSVPGGAPDFEPVIRYNTFGDFSINFNVVMFANDFADQYLIKHEFIKQLHQRYIKEKIEIPFPVRTVYMKQ